MAARNYVRAFVLTPDVYSWVYGYIFVYIHKAAVD